VHGNGLHPARGPPPIFFAARAPPIPGPRRWRSPELAAGCWGHSAAGVAPGPQGAICAQGRGPRQRPPGSGGRAEGGSAAPLGGPGWSVPARWRRMPTVGRPASPRHPHEPHSDRHKRPLESFGSSAAPRMPTRAAMNPKRTLTSLADTLTDQGHSLGPRGDRERGVERRQRVPFA
jgi:hypothetical protein